MKPDQRVKQMSPYALNGGMNLTVANVVDEVTKHLKVTCSESSPDPNDLKGCIEPSMPQEDRYAVEVPVLDYAGGLGP